MSPLTKQEAEKLLASSLEILGLQDDRVKIALRLMYTYGFDYKTAIAANPKLVDIKFQDEVSTDRQKVAFVEWFNAKCRNTGMMGVDVAYEMYVEHLEQRNLLEIELDEVKVELSRLEKHIRGLLENPIVAVC